MTKIFTYLSEVWASATLKKKILYTLLFLAVYRLLVFIPVPFVDINAFMTRTLSWAGGLEFFAMLLWWTLDQFSIIAVGLIPYINASIIMQLLTSVLPQLEELQEQWEVGTMKIQQYTRWLTLPLAFLQSIWMIYFINYLLWGNVINTADKWIVLLTAFALTVGTILIMWIGELITEKWISNWISLIIFASIVSWIITKVYWYLSSAGADMLSIIIFMLMIVLVLIVLTVLLIRTKKEIPVIYARQGKVEQTASLPVPLNPVGMVPIIFAIAFVTFPYLLSQLVIKFGTQNPAVMTAAKWIETHFNIYTQTPGILAIVVYFFFIVLFTFFYTVIMFNPERMSDNIQKRWWFIPGIRPWIESTNYINRILMHLCLWGWIWLWFIWAYGYIIWYIPFIQQATQSLWSIPLIVQWSWVVIIVWVVQDFINKVNSELLMERYDKI